MTVTPLGDKILIARKMEEAVTDGGIYIPEDARDPSQHAYVIAVGTEVTSVKKDDIVITGKYAGAQIDVDGKSCSIVEIEDVLAIVTK